MAARDRSVEIFEQARTAALPARVRGKLDQVDHVRQTERTRKIDEKDRARLERRHEQRLETRVIVCDLAPELENARTDLLAGEEDLPEGATVEWL